MELRTGAASSNTLENKVKKKYQGPETRAKSGALGPGMPSQGVFCRRSQSQEEPELSQGRFVVSCDQAPKRLSCPG